MKGYCGGRHWFAYRLQPGTSSPNCVRNQCDAPNPRYDANRDPREAREARRVLQRATDAANAQPGEPLRRPSHEEMHTPHDF